MSGPPTMACDRMCVFDTGTNGVVLWCVTSSSGGAGAW